MTLLTLILACGSPSDSSDTGKPDDSGTTQDSDTADTSTDTDTDTDTTVPPTDEDGDGFTSDVDCDDTNIAINPDAAEVCDEIDNDCDLLVDSDDDSLTEGSTVWTDADGDKYGDPATEKNTCGSTDGYANNGGDCDDTNPDISPNAPEICDDADTDEDCDGKADDADPNVDTSTYGAWPVDEDGDGFGSTTTVTYACDAVAYDGVDCDDGDDAINPDAEETCGNGLDDNCDTSVGDCAAEAELTLSSDYALKLSGSVANGDFGTGVLLGDVDGDGNPDAWIGEPGAGSDGEGALYLVSGPMGARMKVSDGASIAGSDDSEGFGAVVREGDLDGDGTDDLVVSAWGDTDYPGAISVFTTDMSAGGTSEDATWTATSGTARNYFGTHGLVVDDLDDDGVADLAGWDEVDLGLRVFYGPLGSGSVASSDADVTLTTPSISYPDAGPHLLESGDITGDGLPELALAVPNATYTTTGDGTVWVMAGEDTLSGAFETDAYLILYGEGSNDGAGTDMTMAGDADGDGRNDLVVGSPTSGSGGEVYFLTSAPTGVASLGSADYSITGTSSEHAGEAVDWVGDVNGDGAEDLAIGAPDNATSTSGAGRVAVFYGGITASMETSAADFSVYGEGSSDGCGALVAGGFDMTADGVSDFALTCPGNNRNTGSLWFIAGGGL